MSKIWKTPEGWAAEADTKEEAAQKIAALLSPKALSPEAAAVFAKLTEMPKGG